MSIGLFRGTCEKYIYSEFKFNPKGEAFYQPRGDFDYSLFAALSWAYKKSNETNSQPLVVCLLNPKYLGQSPPLSEIQIMGVRDKQGLESLLKVYEKLQKAIPREFKLDKIKINELFKIRNSV